ncbi:hypothetical protein W822_09460 [Advenella kashmirensis W13003]|uniref:Uncharacterized protein n=1 Tax=Advenella kashmirensis W13003 TaxID=1424334 RepID=V8QV35_9BURK|nr:hypothetical protein W822_09460 [Advenella kashmirensis W13003]
MREIQKIVPDNVLSSIESIFEMLRDIKQEMGLT